MAEKDRFPHEHYTGPTMSDFGGTSRLDEHGNWVDNPSLCQIEKE